MTPMSEFPLGPAPGIASHGAPAIVGLLGSRGGGANRGNPQYEVTRKVR